MDTSAHLDAPWARAAAAANTFDHKAHTVLPTIYERTTAAALTHDALNLGQGFPDRQGPQWLLEAAAEAIVRDDVGPSNQYTPGLGIIELREAVSAMQQSRHGLHLSPETDVMITAGATEGIAASILAFARPGSEVVTFEPFYDSYGACAALSGAELVGVPLRGPDFAPDLEALEAAITDRTSMLLLNTPHNPTGRVFSADDLAQIVQLARKNGLVVMCDEVYEHLVFDETQRAHSSILAVPGAEEVAVAVGSAGKSFSVTGWKVGWLTGNAELVNRVRGVKQFLTFATGPAYQWAISQGLQDDRGFFLQNAAQLQAGSELLRDGLDQLGLRPNNPEAGYFVLADVSGITDIGAESFCKNLVEQTGVAAIPVSALTQQPKPHEDELNHLVRFAFCKDHTTIEQALERMSSAL